MSSNNYYSAYFFYFQEQKRKMPKWKTKTKKELDAFVYESWKQCSYNEKKVYYDMEKEERERIAFSLKRDAEEKMKLKLQELTIHNLVQDKPIDQLLTHEFYVMHCYIFAKTDEESIFVPAEMSCATFSIQDGLRRVYHAFPRPGKIPLGYKGRCLQTSDASHKIPLDNDDEEMKMKINYKEDAEIIHDLEGIIAGENIFVMPELMKQVEGVLKVVADRAGREDFISKISVLPLPNLLYDLVNRPSLMLPSVIIAEHELQQPRFLYHPGFNCEWHEKMTETSCCSSAQVKMLTFTMLAFTCQAYGVDMKDGVHRPHSL